MFKKCKMLIILILLFSCGCSVQHKSNQNSNVTPIPVVRENGLVTVEYVFDNCNLSVMETRGVVVDNVIKLFELTPAKLNSRPFQKWVEDYKRTKIYSDSFKLSYLVKNPAQEAKYDGDGSNIYIAILNLNYGMKNESWLYNFEEEKEFHSNGRIFDDYSDYSEVPLSENVGNDIRTLVVDNVLSWEKQYNGRFDPNSTESFGWDFIIETIDGKIYRYEGSGIYDSKPEGFDEFVEKFASYSSMPLD